MSAGDDELDKWAPGDTTGQRAQRRRLYDGRNIAGARASRSRGWTAEVFRAAEHIAGDWVWSRRGEDELKAVADAMRHLFMAGTTLERVEASHD